MTKRQFIKKQIEKEMPSYEDLAYKFRYRSYVPKKSQEFIPIYYGDKFSHYRRKRSEI